MAAAAPRSARGSSEIEPVHAVHRDAAEVELPGQLARAPGDHQGGDVAVAVLGDGEQPYLSLATAPFPAPGEVQDREPAHSRAASRSSARSSARLNGFCRQGRPWASRKRRVSPRTVSPVLNATRRATSGARWESAS